MFNLKNREMMNLCNRNCCSYAQLIDRNEDVIAEILLNLPVKSLFRFQCVSRKWRSVISCPYFAHRHTRKNSDWGASSLMIIRSPLFAILPLGNDTNGSTPGCRIPSFDFLNVTPDLSLTFLGTCNGLTLCFINSIFVESKYSYCVCNLTTKRFVRLPRPGLIMNKPILSLNLAFDPSESPNFKVVCVGQSIVDDHNCQIEIYSSETRLWRHWNGSFYGSFRNQYNILETYDRGVFCNGALHWLCTVGDSLYFDLKTESLKILPPPPPMDSDIYTMNRVRHLIQSGGHLQFIDSDFMRYDYPSIDIYEMRKDYSGWFLRYSINLNSIACLFPEMIGYVLCIGNGYGYGAHMTKCFTFSVLSVVGGEDGQNLEVIMSIPKKIISYISKENSARIRMYCGDNFNTGCGWYDVFQLKDTLYWL